MKNYLKMESKSSNINTKKAIFEQNLKEGSDEFIISTLEELRENGEDYMIDSIIHLLFTKRSDVLKEAVVNFLVDIKNQSAAVEIIKTIKEKKNSSDVSHLVSVCWQSRLDFSNEIELFMDLLCKADYQTSIEAFSVIENALDNTSDEKIEEYSLYLKNEVKKIAKDKQPLVQQMILVMEEFGGGR